MRHWINEETGKMLAEARKRAGYSAVQVSDYVGFDLFFVETGLISLSMNDLAMLARLYKIPQRDLAFWQDRLATEVQFRRSLLH